MFLFFFRFQKQKEEDDKAINDKQLEELKDQVKTSEEVIEKLKNYNACLEVNLFY